MPTHPDDRKTTGAKLGTRNLERQLYRRGNARQAASRAGSCSRDGRRTAGGICWHLEPMHPTRKPTPQPVTRRE